MNSKCCNIIIFQGDNLLAIIEGTGKDRVTRNAAGGQIILP